MKKQAFLCDIDGTIADNSHRQQWLLSKPKNWPAYNAAMSADEPIAPVISVLKALQHCVVDIVLCSGREEVFKDITVKWLSKYGIPYHKLYMRKKEDYRDDAIVKGEMLKEISKEYNIVGIFEDRKKVKKMWVQNGVFVFDVNQLDKEF